MYCYVQIHQQESVVPSNANGKSSVLPVSSLDNWHFTAYIASRTIEDLMGMAMVGGRVRVRGTVVGVAVRHCLEDQG